MAGLPQGPIGYVIQYRRVKCKGTETGDNGHIQGGGQILEKSGKGDQEKWQAWWSEIGQIPDLLQTAAS